MTTPTPERLTFDISADLRSLASKVNAMELSEEDEAELLNEAADKLDGLIADLATAERERDSLARRCAVRFEETQVAQAEAAQYRDERDEARGAANRLGNAFVEIHDERETELTQALGIIADLVHDDDPCTFDHHGYCQAHGWLTAGECPHARAKRWMAPAAAGADQGEAQAGASRD